VHSPVDIGITDDQGRFTGFRTDSEGRPISYEEIPNSYALLVGESKYIGISGSIAGIGLVGTGYGTFSLDIEYVSGDTTVSAEVFENILVTPQLLGTTFCWIK